MLWLKNSLKNPILAFVLLLGFGLFADFAFDAFVQLMLIFILINTILAMSLNLVNGYTGQFSLGHAGFMATGAYFSAWTSTQLPQISSAFPMLGFFVYSIAGGLLAALAGFLVGQPSLRLRGDYLAIVTLGFGEIIRVVLLNTQAVGGARGFYGIPGMGDIQVGPVVISKFMQNYLFGSIWMLITFVVIWRLIESEPGRAFLSVREDEVAAEAMGINTTKTKVRAFVLSSFFAGIAGSIFAHFTNYLSPATFTFNKSVDVVIMVVLGGMGSLSGSILAAVLITIIPEALRPLQEVTGVDLRMVIYSLLLISMMILRPQGLFGKLEIPDLIKRWKRG
jgi:branched-chain amino acid transport system permease protein